MRCNDTGVEYVIDKGAIRSFRRWLGELSGSPNRGELLGPVPPVNVSSAVNADKDVLGADAASPRFDQTHLTRRRVGSPTSVVRVLAARKFPKTESLFWQHPEKSFGVAEGGARCFLVCRGGLNGGLVLQ